MENNRSTKRAQRKRSNKEEREEFVRSYIHGSKVFFGEIPTQQDIAKAWAEHKKTRKCTPVKAKPKHEMTKEELVAEYHQGCKMWGEAPSENEINYIWDLIIFGRQYKAIRGKTKADKYQKQQVFLEHMEQEIKRRYFQAPAEKQEVSEGGGVTVNL